METRSALVRSLVEPGLLAQLRDEAAEQRRSLSFTVHEILAEWAAARRQQMEERAA